MKLSTVIGVIVMIAMAIKYVWLGWTLLHEPLPEPRDEDEQTYSL